MSTATNEAPDTRREVERVIEAARDAVTDEMVGRMAGTASEALDLIDQVNRSGLASAIPILAQMVNNGDLQRLVNLARVYGSAEDAATDEMVGRLTEAVGGGLSLIDQINRSGLDKALPTLSRMVADGDLERLAQLARVYGSAQDALSDEMVGRIAETMGEGLSLLDRLNRGGAGRLVEMLERLESTGALERIARVLPQLLERLDMVGDLLECVEAAAAESAKPAAEGGLGGMWRLITDAKTQEALKFMVALGGRLKESCGRRSSSK